MPGRRLFLSQFDEIRSGMLAYRTDIILRQRIPFVDVAAYCADKALFFCLFGSGLDMLVIIGVGDGFPVAQNAAVGDIRQEKGVTAEVNGVVHLCADVCVTFAGDINYAVFTSAKIESLGLVSVGAALKAPVSVGIKYGVLRQYGHVEFAGSGYHIMGVVAFADGDCNPFRLSRYLHHGIDDAAVISAAVLCGQNVQSIRYFLHSIGFHILILYPTFMCIGAVLVRLPIAYQFYFITIFIILQQIY